MVDATTALSFLNMYIQKALDNQSYQKFYNGNHANEKRARCKIT